MPSPFLYGNPVTSPYFAGRRPELARVLGRLAQHGQSTAIVGEPRMGKTSLLEHLASADAADAFRSADRAHILVSYIDAHTLDEGLGAPSFWEVAFQALDDPGSSLAGDAAMVAALRACRAGGFQTRDLRALLSALQAAGARLILLIDEFDYLVQNSVANPRTFFGSLRSIVTLSRGTLTLVTASRRPLDYLDAAAQGAGYTGSPYFNFIAEETLGPLGRADLDAILSWAGDRFSPDDRQAILDLAGGHPYFVQLTADALWQAYEDGEPDPAVRRGAASERALREASRILGDTWRHWSPAQRFLVASAALSTVVPAASKLDLFSFPVEIEALRGQGFLDRSVSPRIVPRLLEAWCIREMHARTHTADPLREWIEQGEGNLPLSAAERQAWSNAVRGATTGMPPGDPPASIRVAPHARRKLFFSYSHEDARYREQLDRHLAALKWEGAVETWHDQRIEPGADWRASIAGALGEADVILLLISADFIASDFCVGVEMKEAIARHYDRKARVIPIAVRPVDWGNMPFAALQALPSGAKPIVLWEDQDAAWTDVVDGIRRIVASMRR